MNKYHILLLCCFIIACNQDIDQNGRSKLVMPNDISIYALGLTEIYNYEKYDFCLFYLEHNPHRISWSYELYIKENKAYSYTKYMNNVVSTAYPPVYSENNDSIYYSVTFRQPNINVEDKLHSMFTEFDLYKIASPEIQFEDSHDSRWLVVYDKKNIHSIYNWNHNSKIQTKIIKYIKRNLMQYDDKTIDKLQIEGPPFEQNIPPNRHIP